MPKNLSNFLQKHVFPLNIDWLLSKQNEFYSSLFMLFISTFDWELKFVNSHYYDGVEKKLVLTFVVMRVSLL